MCVIFFAFRSVKTHPLILIGNRDEFYKRRSGPAEFWNDHPDIYGGRDLERGGTWLGVTRSGRFATVTNYRDPSAPRGSRSRGELAANFLRSDQSAADYLDDLVQRSGNYSGFNLLVGEISISRKEMFYYSNRGTGPRQLTPGIYGLSNHLLDTPWPKVVKGKDRFEELVRSGNLSDDELFSILSDATLAEDEDLPSTGLSYEAEKAVSAIFIKTPGYGTRCSTVLRFGRSAKWSFDERVFL